MITITPRINQQSHKQQIQACKKSSAVSFKGYTTLFTKELDVVLRQGKADWQQESKLVKFINSFIQNKMTHQRLVNEGHYGKVYKLDSKYVLKILKKENIFANMLSGLSHGKFKELKTYYGEHIAEFEDVFVLKNMSPQDLHIPVGVPKKFKKLYFSKGCKDYYEKVYLPLFASVSQKSYNAIAKDCAQLNKMRNGEYFLSFDYCNPNNFVLSGKSLRITDDITNTALDNPNTASDLLEVFLDKMTRYEPAPKTDDKDVLHYRRDILKKIVIAANTYKLPLGDEIAYCASEWKYILDKMCKIKESYLDVLDNLKSIQREVPDKTKRTKATEKYLDRLIRESESY